MLSVLWSEEKGKYIECVLVMGYIYIYNLWFRLC